MRPVCDPVRVVQSSRAGHAMVSGLMRGEKDERRDAMTIHPVSVTAREGTI